MVAAGSFSGSITRSSRRGSSASSPRLPLLPATTVLRRIRRVLDVLDRNGLDPSRVAVMHKANGRTVVHQLTDVPWTDCQEPAGWLLIARLHPILLRRLAHDVTSLLGDDTELLQPLARAHVACNRLALRAVGR